MPCHFRMWVMTALHCFSFLCLEIFAFIIPLLLYSFSQMGFIAVFYPHLLCFVSIKFSKPPFLITSPKSLCCLFPIVSNCFFVISVLHKSLKKNFLCHLNRIKLRREKCDLQDFKFSLKKVPNKNGENFVIIEVRSINRFMVGKVSMFCTVHRDDTCAN